VVVAVVAVIDAAVTGVAAAADVGHRAARAGTKAGCPAPTLLRSGGEAV